VRLSKTGPFLLVLGAVLAVSCGGATSAAHAAKSVGAPAVSSQPAGSYRATVLKIACLRWKLG
jgi:hypothetical protein